MIKRRGEREARGDKSRKIRGERQREEKEKKNRETENSYVKGSLAIQTNSDTNSSKPWN